MAEESNTVDYMKTRLNFFRNSVPEQTVKGYDSWAQTYDKDTTMLKYGAPKLAVDFLSENLNFLSENFPEEALVYDVACGSGLVAKLMSELGFKHFVGTDGSKGMLELAEKTGLYQETHLAVLGPEPLPKQTGVFDVVMIIGCMGAGYAPVSVIRELCNAAKPGGLICMSKGDHIRPGNNEYRVAMETELQQMEREGLWRKVKSKHQVEGFVDYPDLDSSEDLGNRIPISGNLYLYRKAIKIE